MNHRTHYGAHALRKGRFSCPNQIYLVTIVTHARTPLFNDFNVARTLIAELRQSDSGQLTSTLAWVVMPDHMHWLFGLGERMPLAKLLQRIKGRSAKSINETLNARGQPIWQKGYHDRAIRREEDLKAIARYILANPLRAGITDKLANYPHWDAAWL